jgi:hypothetical protein
MVFNTTFLWYSKTCLINCSLWYSKTCLINCSLWYSKKKNGGKKKHSLSRTKIQPKLNQTQLRNNRYLLFQHLEVLLRIDNKYISNVTIVEFFFHSYIFTICTLLITILIIFFLTQILDSIFELILVRFSSMKCCKKL